MSITVTPTPAPVVPSAPAAAPQAPVITPPVAPPIDTTTGRAPLPEATAPGMTGMIEKISRKLTPAASEGTPFVSSTGQPIPVDASATPTTSLTETPAASAVAASADPVVPTSADGIADPTAPVAQPTMVAEIKSDEPEGEVVLRARDPNTGQFSEMDQTRVYELSIKDKQTGETKVYNKTLPDLMRMAKDGVGAQRTLAATSDEINYYRQNVPQWQQTHAQLAQDVEGLRALAVNLLTGPEEEVVRQREVYASELSPERENARLKARLQQVEQHEQLTAQQRAVSQQIAALGSRIGATISEVQQSVGPEAAAGKILMDTAHLMVNGRIPPEHFPALEQYVSGPLRQWAQGQAAQRQQASAEIQRQAEAARQAQATAQRTVNQVAAPLRPTGALSAGVQPAPGKPKNVSDAINRIVQGNGRPIAGAA